MRQKLRVSNPWIGPNYPHIRNMHFDGSRHKTLYLNIIEGLNSTEAAIFFYLTHSLPQLVFWKVFFGEHVRLLSATLKISSLSSLFLRCQINPRAHPVNVAHIEITTGLNEPPYKKNSLMIRQAQFLVQYDHIHPTKFQNRALRGFCTICIFVFFQ